MKGTEHINYIYSRRGIIVVSHYYYYYYY